MAEYMCYYILRSKHGDRKSIAVKYKAEVSRMSDGRKDDYKKYNYDSNSFRSRSRSAQLRRKKSVKRTRIILANSVLAILIIIGILVYKVSALNKSDSNSDKNVVKVEKEDKKDNSNKEKAKPTPAPTPTATPAPDGKKRWLREDLDPEKPMVALTFDDGPYAPVTRKILSTLKKYDARATFFVVGNRISAYTDTLKMAYEQGNEIASHTYDHVNLTTLTKQGIKKELSKSRKAQTKAIGCSYSVVRPPGGSINDLMRSTLKVPMIYWSVDTEDWKSRNKTAVLKQCKVIQDGDIVLMHDLYPSTAEAVKKLVPRLTKQGYQLVTIDELFKYKGIKAQGGKVYVSGRK